MYRGRLERDLALWVEKGMLDAAAARGLLAEYDSRPASFSLGRVLLVLAALLVSAAILLLIASNWEAIPRLIRVVAILGLIWFFYISAALLTARGAFASATAMLLLGTMSFGGAISLIGQMYHLSGDQLTVMFLWFGVAVLGAVLFRSAALVALSGFLSWASFAVYLQEYDVRWAGLLPWSAPLMACILILLVRFTGAHRARHLAYMLMIAWLTWLYTLREDVVTALAFAICGMAALVLVSLRPPPLDRLLRDAGAAPAFYSFLVGVIGLLLLHGEIDSGWKLIVLGIATLAAAILAIVLQGRDNGAVRYLAYAAFAAETFYLASITVGTIIGTSGFFLGSGLFVALVAWLVIRLERRFSGERTEVAP
ncbi:DUF2157 domain-containing protein [Rhizobium sp. BK251]|uniref:DUF2157 domain-containing protein n=1 Tax=Rhizobium sp. BK251 TaxID=2512125 RepID=UPI0010468D4F|nr:DUF2157 domain-containing protein [Rhizobium sp. BK251]TCL67298.1 putative membrane protein [Rhizobium sp. BK251]